MGIGLGLIIMAAWAIGSAVLLNNFKDVLAERSAWVQLLTMIILMFGCPFFFIVELLELALDAVLGDGWDDDS